MSSSTSNNIIGSNTNICSSLSDQSVRRNSLVKWLENSQFDVNNEWVGRLTAVPHSSIIDFDTDDLKPGIEISVIRNNGEIWRAQVIIPKTSSNTIDLPPSSSKKIRTKAMGSTGKAIIEHDTSSSSLDQSGLLDFNDLSSTNELGTTSVVPVLTSTSNNNSLIILTTNTNNNNSLANTSSPNNNNNKTKSNKEWQFLQTAINETNLTDFYPEQTGSTVIKLNNLTHVALNNNNTTTTNTNTVSNNGTKSNNNNNTTTNSIVSVSGLNIETILQMQCDLLEQQKELKSIELDTMEQLRILQQNISKLTRKFDSFEATCATYFSAPNGSNSDLKSVKNVFNKFNSSIKLVESELLKEYQQVSANNNMNNNSSTVNNNNNNNTAGPSSLSSSSSSSSPATTTVTLTNHGDLNNHHHHQLTESNNNIKSSNTTIVNLFQSTSSTINRTVKKQENDSNNENVYLVQTNASTINNNKSNKSQGMQTQMALNKFLRESVKQKLGAEFLIAHAVSDIPVHIMRQIKKEAFEKYLPNDQRPIKAWGLAMASLRCLKRDLVKNKNKQLAAAAAAEAAAAGINTALNNTETVVEMEKVNSSNEMDCDLKLESDNLNTNINNNNNNKTTRRSGINLTVASSLSYIPTRSTTISNVLNHASTVRRQLNTANNNSK